MIKRSELTELYQNSKLSAAQIAEKINCSEGKVNYWLSKYEISKRSISEAIYQKHNPLGDPFMVTFPKNVDEGVLYGLGLGLYWGEGAKRGNGGVRLGNTDANLIRKFIDFLEVFYSINKKSLHFGLQIFGDISPEKALSFWTKTLKVSKKQFYKIIISKVRGSGTYKYKSENGVLMVYFNNIKLKRLLCDKIDNI
ncbi:MAG: hypothetical protein WC250_03385 [Candidatus Paceibacterota bacterium]|jgi:DNA-binding Lrp family transcriptional regulator